MRPFYPNIIQYVPKKLHLVLRLANSTGRRVPVPQKLKNYLGYCSRPLSYRCRAWSQVIRVGLPK